MTTLKLSEKRLATFWSYVDKSGDCWVWKGARDGGGYGAFLVNGKVIAAHRIAYELARGPIPAGKLIRHRCDNRACLRDEHLLVGSHAENSADMLARGRHRTPFAGEAWRQRQTGDGNSYRRALAARRSASGP